MEERGKKRKEKKKKEKKREKEQCHTMQKGKWQTGRGVAPHEG